MFTAGMAAVTLATIMWIVDHYQVKWWTKPFVVYGVNPIVAFVGSGVMARLIYRSEEHTSELQSQSNLVCRLLLEKKSTTLLQAVTTASAAAVTAGSSISAPSTTLTISPNALLISPAGRTNC